MSSTNAEDIPYSCWDDGTQGNAQLRPIADVEAEDALDLEAILDDLEETFRNPNWIGGPARNYSEQQTMPYREINVLITPGTSIAGNVSSSALCTTGALVRNTFSNYQFEVCKLEDIQYAQSLIMSKRGRHDHSEPQSLSVADDSTFEKWMTLPETDGRTIEEFAENPVFVSANVQPPVSLVRERIAHFLFASVSISLVAAIGWALFIYSPK